MEAVLGSGILTDSESWSVEVEHARGSAGAFHERDVPTDGNVKLWWFSTERDALVLGSSQSFDVVDDSACRQRGVEVVRRRSGGGAVLLVRQKHLWLDVVLPSNHPLWDPDVTNSSLWLGEAWIKALETCGVHGLVQHRSPLTRSALSDLICFAGRGPGEVFLPDGSKVVGISQRRTRQWARFQCVVCLEWQPDLLVALLDHSLVRDHFIADMGLIADMGSSLDIDRVALVTAMTETLTELLAGPGAR